MKPHRVTIKYRNGDQTCVISTTVPAYNERQAISKIIEANGLVGKVVRRRAELINP